SMTRFGPDPQAFFDGIYQDVAPWDVGRAQPALTELLEEHPPHGPVLDLGCGTGDLAIHIARQGLEVLGVDTAATAIAEARGRAGAGRSRRGRRGSRHGGGATAGG